MAIDVLDTRIQAQGYVVLARVIRALPHLRGKVRIAHAAYEWLFRTRNGFQVIAPLFDSQILFKLNLDCNHERMALLMSEYEDGTATFLENIYESGNILDVGANIGLISLPLMVKLEGKQKHATIYAIEAMNSNFEVLKFNLALNKLEDRVVPINMALGAEDGKTVNCGIEGDDPSRTGTANILPDKFDFRRLPVTLRSIDGLVADGTLPQDIGLIKIDTDGYDFEILKGARALISECRPIIFTEMANFCLINWHGYDMNTVVAYMSELDYEVWPKKSEQFVFQKWRNDYPFVIDALLVPKEKREDFEHLLAQDSVTP